MGAITDNVMKDEATMAEEMNKLTFYFLQRIIQNAGVVGGASPTDILEKYISYLKTAICGISAKEKAMAQLIMGVARLDSAVSGIDPSEVCCKCCGKTRHQTTCDCKCNTKMGC